MMAADLGLIESCLEVSGQVCSLGSNYDGNTVQSLLEKYNLFRSNARLLQHTGFCKRLLSASQFGHRRSRSAEPNWKFSS